MAYHSLLENLRSEYPEARSDGSPGRVPSLVPAGGAYAGTNAIRFQLAGGKNQQTVWAPRTLPTPMSGTFAVSAAFRFPRGFDWTSPPGVEDWGHEHKLFIINTQNSVGRTLINLRGAGNSPNLAIHFEKTDPYGEFGNSHGQNVGVSVITQTSWPTDGEWHTVSAEIGRSGSGNDPVKLLLDGKVILNVRGRTCGSPPSPINQYIVGAFYNQGSTGNQEFFVTAIADGSSGDVVIGQPPVTPPPTGQQPDIAGALIQLTAMAATISDMKAELTKIDTSITAVRSALQPK